MLFWLCFQSSLRICIHISKALVSTVLVSLRYLTDFLQLCRFSWKSRQSTINSGMFWEAHKCSANTWWVSGNIEEGYTWLLKQVNKKVSS